MTTELVEIKKQVEELHEKYRQYLPKVDPALRGRLNPLPNYSFSPYMPWFVLVFYKLQDRRRKVSFRLP